MEECDRGQSHRHEHKEKHSVIKNIKAKRWWTNDVHLVKSLLSSVIDLFVDFTFN